MKKRAIDTSRKEAYRHICEEQQMPLFMEHWWLEGVEAGKDWDVLLIYDRTDPKKVIAAMPYELGRVLWIRYVRQPEMSPYGGVWVHPDYREDKAHLQYISEQIAAGIKALKIRSYRQYYSIGSHLPERISTMQGFSSIMRRTYVLDPSAGPEACLQGFSRNKRKKLERIRSTYHIEELDPEDFYIFHRTTQAQKRITINYTREMLLVIYEKALDHGAARLIGVRSEEGQLLAAALLVWDNTTLYQLVNTFDHDFPDNGARELLTLEAIKQASELGLQIDFVHHRDYLKHYGAQKRNYYSLHRGAMPVLVLSRFVTWLEHL